MKTLGIKFDSKHFFVQHISDLCKKTGRKVNTLPRITPFMDLSMRTNEFFCLAIGYYSKNIPNLASF